MIIETKEKTVSPSLWSNEMDIETINVFFRTVTVDVATKKVVHVNQQMHWQKSDVNRRMLIEFF